MNIRRIIREELEKAFDPFGPNNPTYKEAFFDHGDETEETWRDYGMDSVVGAINWAKGLEFPLTIYRGIKAESGDDVLNPPQWAQGTSWTTNPRVADRFASGPSGAIFSAVIDRDNVDFEYTIAQKLRYKSQDEEEISPIDLHKLRDVKRIK